MPVSTPVNHPQNNSPAVDADEFTRIRKRVWVQNVAVQAKFMEVKLDTLRARNRGDPAAEAIDKGVRNLLRTARDAAHRDNPTPTKLGNWWRGTLIEAAYQNLHAAEALMAGLYDKSEIKAELPEAAARVEVSLSREDPRRMSAMLFLEDPDAVKAEQLRKLIEVGYGAGDRKHARLRSFRNLLIGTTLMITVFVAVFVGFIMSNPKWVPLCFAADGPDLRKVCATGGAAPQAEDIFVIALLGLLGGALAAAVSIRNISGTATPYEVPAALAILKVPFGAMTSVGVLIAIGGDFIPGLSNLDSQVQILAYALLFGYAQQLLTGFIDRQAESMLAAIPLKDASVPRPEIPMRALQPSGA